MPDAATNFAITDSPATTDACYRCGYALHGIANDQACPECGLLAERSRRVTDELFDSHPRWLNGISRGIRLLLVAVLIVVLSPFVWLIIEGQARQAQMRAWQSGVMVGGRPVMPSWVQFVPSLRLAGFDLAAVLVFIAILLITRREGNDLADRADRWRRWTLRSLAFIPIVSLTVFHAQQQYEQRRFAMWGFAPRTPTLDSFLEIALIVAIALVTVGCVPLPWLLFRQLRSLAKRAHSAHLAEHCTIVGVIGSLSLLYLSGILFVGANANRWLGSYWTERSDTWLVVMLIMSVSAVLVVLWSLYLLTRFSISFHRAAAMLRRKWTNADRSLAN